MLILVVHMTMKIGADDSAVEPFRKLEEESRREPGCLMYVVQRSREDPRRFLVYEQYEDEAALEAHRNSPHFKQYATDGVFRLVEERRAELFNPI